MVTEMLFHAVAVGMSWMWFGGLGNGLMTWTQRRLSANESMARDVLSSKLTTIAMA